MGGQGLLLLMELKVLIMITRPQNITVVTLLAGNSNVLWPGNHYQNFKFHQQQEALAAHFDFTFFSAQSFFRFLATIFFTPGVFWLGFHFFFYFFFLFLVFLIIFFFVTM